MRSRLASFWRGIAADREQAFCGEGGVNADVEAVVLVLVGLSWVLGRGLAFPRFAVAGAIGRGEGTGEPRPIRNAAALVRRGVLEAFDVVAGTERALNEGVLSVSLDVLEGAVEGPLSLPRPGSSRTPGEGGGPLVRSRRAQNFGVSATR